RLEGEEVRRERRERIARHGREGDHRYRDLRPGRHWAAGEELHAAEVAADDEPGARDVVAVLVPYGCRPGRQAAVVVRRHRTAQLEDDALVGGDVRLACTDRDAADDR